MKIAKAFIDGQGRRMKPGMDVPADYDKQTMAHYLRRGMVAEVVKPAEPARKARARPAPAETKPAAPAEVSAAPVLAVPPGVDDGGQTSMLVGSGGDLDADTGSGLGDD